MKVNSNNTFKKTFVKLKRFTSKTSIHGISHIGSSHSVIKTIIWSILLLCSFGALIYFIIYTVLNYVASNVVIHSDVIDSVPMELPTITICNMNSYKSYQNYSIDEMILSCLVDSSTDCNSTQFIEIPISTYKCFSFNSGLDKNNQRVEMMATSRKGFLYGLSLKLFGGFPEEATLNTNGFLVFIHDSKLIPLVEEGHIVTASKFAYISLEKTVTQKLSHPFNDCYKNMSSPELKHLELVQRIVNSNNSHYKRDHCFTLYYKRGQTKTCKCSIPTEWEIAGLESCRLSKFTQCLRNEYTRIIKEEFSSKVLKECPAECDSLDYRKSVTIGDFGTPTEINSLLNGSAYLRERTANKTWDEIRNSLLFLRVFFNELKYTKVTQIPKINVADLVAAIGGTMGLFLGMSFISSFEIVILLFEITCCALADKLGAKRHLNNSGPKKAIEETPSQIPSQERKVENNFSSV